MGKAERWEATTASPSSRGRRLWRSSNRPCRARGARRLLGRMNRWRNFATVAWGDRYSRSSRLLDVLEGIVTQRGSRSWCGIGGRAGTRRALNLRHVPGSKMHPRARRPRSTRSGTRKNLPARVEQGVQVLRRRSGRRPPSPGPCRGERARSSGSEGLISAQGTYISRSSRGRPLCPALYARLLRASLDHLDWLVQTGGLRP